MTRPNATDWRCACGGLLDIAPAPAAFPRDAIAARPGTQWRYREALPVDALGDAVDAVTMGEGMTPLLRSPIDGLDLRLKVDFLMPTLSYKDRGAAMLVAQALAVGADRLVADSSGNAGTAISAYAARAGLPCTVFVRAGTSAGKLAQMRAHGARVVEVPGTREDAAAAAIDVVITTGAFYASHVYSPFFTEGTKTLGFEVWEQLGWTAPAAIVLPVGNGTLVLGVGRAFDELQAAGAVDRVPRIVAVQAAACAPIARAFATGTEVREIANEGTKAEGIAIAAPARGDQVLDVVRRSGGTVVTVDDAATLAARDDLASAGLFVEPTAAAAWAAACATAADGRLGSDGPVVVELTGAGLKAA